LDDPISPARNERVICVCGKIGIFTLFIYRKRNFRGWPKSAINNILSQFWKNGLSKIWYKSTSPWFKFGHSLKFLLTTLHGILCVLLYSCLIDAITFISCLTLVRKWLTREESVTTWC